MMIMYSFLTPFIAAEAPYAFHSRPLPPRRLARSRALPNEPRQHQRCPIFDHASSPWLPRNWPANPASDGHAPSASADNHPVDRFQ